jgi:hypothetical protein
VSWIAVKIRAREKRRKDKGKGAPSEKFTPDMVMSFHHSVQRMGEIVLRELVMQLHGAEGD